MRERGGSKRERGRMRESGAMTKKVGKVVESVQESERNVGEGLTQFQM